MATAKTVLKPILLIDVFAEQLCIAYTIFNLFWF